MRESELEREVCRRIREKGGWTAKLRGTINGLPDRVCCLPNQGVFFIEFKAGRNDLTMLQRSVIGQIEKAGGKVLVIRRVEDFTE